MAYGQDQLKGLGLWEIGRNISMSPSRWSLTPRCFP